MPLLTASIPLPDRYPAVTRPLPDRYPTVTWPLQDLALSNLSAVDTAGALTAHFGRLQSPQLAQIAEELGLLHSQVTASSGHGGVNGGVMVGKWWGHGEEVGLLHSQAQGEARGKPFLVQLLVNRYERRTPQHEAIGALSLYPDEKKPWDPAVVPDADFRGDTCLALPKLNLQVGRGGVAVESRWVAVGTRWGHGVVTVW